MCEPDECTNFRGLGVRLPAKSDIRSDRTCLQPLDRCQVVKASEVSVLPPVLQLPRLKTLTLMSRVEHGGRPGEGRHCLVHARELAALLARLRQRRPDLEVNFCPVFF